LVFYPLSPSGSSPWKGERFVWWFFECVRSPQPFGQLPLERGAVCVVFFGVCEISSALWAAPLGKGSGLCGGFLECVRSPQPFGQLPLGRGAVCVVVFFQI